MDVQIKRAYEAPAPADGYRVLIDRLWPRGVWREHARLDEWVRELAPSTELADQGSCSTACANAPARGR